MGRKTRQQQVTGKKRLQNVFSDDDQEKDAQHHPIGDKEAEEDGICEFVINLNDFYGIKLSRETKTISSTMVWIQAIR